MIYFPISGVSQDLRGSLTAPLNAPSAMQIPAAYDNGADIDLIGAAITMRGTDLDTRGLVVFGGVFTGGAGAVAWQQGTGDVGRVAAYTAQLTATFPSGAVIASHPFLYSVTMTHDATSQRIERRLVDSVPVYSVVALTADEQAAAANAQAIANDAMIPAATLRQLLAPPVASITPENEADYAVLFSSWMVGVQYAIDDVARFGSVLWQCRQAHKSQADWKPPITSALWNRVTETGQVEWLAGVTYKINDEVTHNGLRYQCRQAHRSQIGWEPPNVPALWLPI